MTKGRSPIQNQGFVVIDLHNTRMKVKSMPYTMLAELEQENKFASVKNKERNYLFLVRTTYYEAEKFVKYYPMFKDWYLHVFKLFTSLCEKVDGICLPIRHMENQAEFAKLVPKVAFANLIFVLKRNPQFTNTASYLCDTKWLDDTRGTRSLETTLFQ